MARYRILMVINVVGDFTLLEFNAINDLDFVITLGF